MRSRIFSDRIETREGIGLVGEPPAAVRGAKAPWRRPRAGTC